VNFTAKVAVVVVGLAVLGTAAGRQVALQTNAANNVSQSNGTKSDDPKAFVMTGSVSGLAPGVSRVLQVSVANRSSQPIRVLMLSATVTLLSSPPGPAGAPPCDVAQIAISPYNSRAAGATPYKVAGRSSASVPLQVTFLNTSSNQDGCKGRHFNIKYVGTAEQWH
jgi:hypothetical protein